MDGESKDTLVNTKRDLTELVKALDMTAAGDILMQPEIDKVIQSLIEVNNPLRQNLPRKQGSGKSWLVNRRTAAPDAAWVNDTEEPDASNSTYGQIEFPYKTVLSRGKVTRKLQAVGRTYADIKAEEINACLDEIRDAEEWAIINGHVSVDTKQPDGLRALITAYDSEAQVVDAADGALTLDMMDDAIDRCLGMPDMIICSKRTRRELNGLLQQNQRFVDKTEVKGGFKLTSYNDIPIYYSQHILDTQSTGTESDLFIVDSSKFWIGVLTELHMEPLAKTSSQFDEFDVVEDMVCVMGNPRYCARIKDIAPPSE